MRDWEAYVRDRLPVSGLDAARETRIVGELAAQLEDFYRDALARGEPDAEADAHAQQQITDWAAMAAAIARAERAHAASALSRASQHLDEHAVRRGGGWRVLADGWREIRYAARQLASQPAFTLLAVITLALGIGANTAIFSVVHGVLLRALPYPEADRLVAIWADDTRAQEARSYFSAPAIRDLREQTTSFDALSGLSPRWSFTLRGDGEPERIFGYYASSDILRTLGMPPALGRGLTPEDDRPAAAPVAMLTHGMWQRRFGGDPTVIGRPIDLGEIVATVVGVLPAGVGLVDGTGEAAQAEVWLPLELNAFAARGRGVRVFTLLGRLRDNVTEAEARAEVTAIAARLAAQYPDTDAGLGATLLPLREQVVGAVRPLLVALSLAVALVLLIACANVANLMLARATTRQRQLAIRAALGAGRWRLASGPVAEGALLSLAGGLAGLALARWTLGGFLAMAPAALPRRGEIAMDGPVLLFTLAAAALTALVFALAPALQASRADVMESLKDGGRGSGGRPRHRLRRALVVAQVGLALMVLTASALLLPSFIKLQRVEPGFAVANVAVMDLSSLAAEGAGRTAQMEAIYERLGALRGIVAAGETSRLPLAGIGGNPASNLMVERTPVPPGQEPAIDFRRASRGYFRAMGIPLASGRLFDRRDSADPAATRVALINQAASDRFFAGQDPIGQRIQLGGPPWLTIVGVVGDIRHTGLRDVPRPEAYIHTLQGPLSNPQLVVRTAGDPLEAVPEIRAAIRAVDPGIVVSRVSTLESVRHASLATPRFSTALFSLFAALALVLGVVGIYGVMSYAVTERTREIGVRMALGAERGHVLRMVLADGMALAAAGVLIGMAGALGVGRVMRSLLYGVSPYDPLTIGAAAALLLATALLACWVPARRATRADPLAALRAE